MVSQKKFTAIELSRVEKRCHHPWGMNSISPASIWSSIARALAKFPIFDGRLSVVRGAMRIRCAGKGVPFTAATSDLTLCEAIRAAAVDDGLWLVDAVDGVTARWGLGPLCRVRVTHLSDDSTAIGFSWHHAIGDMQTVVHFMNAWAAAATGQPIVEPLIVEDRPGHLTRHLPPEDARQPGVRCMGLAETARIAYHLARQAPRQRTLTLYFGDDEIARMRRVYGTRMSLTANDVVCAHIAEALMAADPDVDRRTLSITVNARHRCGLDPMLAGNIITTLNVDLRRGDDAEAIAERIRHGVDHFVDEHCDIRTNQRFLDRAGWWRGLRCVSNAVDPSRWNPVVTNLSSFGLYRIPFENTVATYCTMLMVAPVPGLGALINGVDGHGLVFQMALPPKEFHAMTAPAVQDQLHRFASAADPMPRLHGKIHVP